MRRAQVALLITGALSLAGCALVATPFISDDGQTDDETEDTDDEDTDYESVLHLPGADQS